MKQLILNTTILMVSSLLCTLQVSSCSQAEKGKQQNPISILKPAFDSFIQEACNTKVQYNNSSPVELGKTTAIGNDLAHTAGAALNKKRDKTSETNNELSTEEADVDFVRNVRKKDLEFTENRKQFEARIETACEFVKDTVKSQLCSMAQQAIDSLEKTQEGATMLNMPPQAVLEELSNLPIEVEEEKQIGIIKNVIQNLHSIKGIKTTKELLLQAPAHLIATMGQGFNTVAEIKTLLAGTAEATIKQLPKKLNELLLWHKEFESCQSAFNVPLNSSDLSLLVEIQEALSSSFLPKIQETFSALEGLHEKIDNNNNHAGELHDILSELKKIYEQFLANYKSFCATLSTCQDVGYSSIEEYFLVLEIIYTHHYALMLVEKTVNRE